MAKSGYSLLMAKIDTKMNLTVRVTPELRKRIDRQAQKSKQRLSDWVRITLDTAAKSQKEGK